MIIAAAWLIVACDRAPTPSEPDSLPPPSPATDSRPSALTVYTDLDETSIGEVLDAFRAETGKALQVVTGERRAAALPDADLYLIGSLSGLWHIAEADGFRPFETSEIDTAIPAAVRDPESRWSALALRPRLVFFNTAQLAAHDISSVHEYADLRSATWKGLLCLSSSRVPGNRSLVAMLIRDHGVREAELIVRDWQANLAEAVFPTDPALIAAVMDGRCAVGIADAGALFAIFAGNQTAPLGFASLAGETLNDVTGAGIARHAHDPLGALHLLQWLTMSAPNALLASRELAFPANPDARVSASLDIWGKERPVISPLSEISFLHEDAEKLVERARYP